VDVVRKGYSVIKRIGLLLVAALMAAMMTVATAAPAFAVSSGTCTNNGCKEGPTKEHFGSPSGKNTDKTPFSTSTTQQNSPKAKKANKLTECVLLPNGNPKPGQENC
jgi:hypothetical protein